MRLLSKLNVNLWVKSVMLLAVSFVVFKPSVRTGSETCPTSSLVFELADADQPYVVSLSLQNCGDRCLILAENSDGNTIAIYDAADKSLIFELADVYPLDNVVSLSLQECGDRCLIRAFDNNNLVVAIYDTADKSLVFELADADQPYVVNLSLQECGDRCLIRAFDNNNLVVAIYDAADKSLVFELADAYPLNVVQLVPQECGGRCLILARNSSFQAIAIYDAADKSLVFELADAYPLDVVQLRLQECGGRCLITVLDSIGGPIAIYDASDKALVFDLADAYPLDVVRLILQECDGRCLIQGLNSTFSRVAFFDAADKSIVFELADAYPLDPFSMSLLECGDRCLIQVQVVGIGLVAIYDADDKSLVFEVADAYPVDNVETVQIASCGDRCLIAGLNSSNDIIAFFDAADKSLVFELADADQPGADRLSTAECGGRCLIQVEGSNGSVLAFYDAADKALVFELADAYPLTVTRLIISECGGRCFISAQTVDGFNLLTLAIYDAADKALIFDLADTYPLTADALSLSINECGGFCLIQAQTGPFFDIQALAIYNATNKSLLFDLADAYSSDADQLLLTRCGDSCKIQVQNSSDQTLAIYELLLILTLLDTQTFCATCNGASDGSIKGTVCSGTPPYIATLFDGNGYQQGLPIEVNYEGDCFIFEGLEPDTYSVLVTDSGYEEVTASDLVVGEPAAIVETADFSICILNGTTPLSATTDVGYCQTLDEYGNAVPMQDGGVWSGAGVEYDDGQGNAIFNPVAAGVGTHTLTFTAASDPSGYCFATVEATVLPNPAINIDYGSALPPYCCEDERDVNLTATDIVPGGSWDITPQPAYGFVADDEYGTAVFNPAAAGPGVYVITYDNTAGYCQDEIILTVLECLEVVADSRCATCFGSADGEVDVTVIGGLAPYTINFGGYNFDDQVVSQYGDETFSGLEAGTFTIEVTDANGCVTDPTTVDVVVGEPSELVISAADSVTCFSGELIALTAITNVYGCPELQSGGIWTGAGVEYDDGAGNAFFNPSAAGAGTHTLRFTANSNGYGECFDELDITVYPDLLVETAQELEACRNDEFCYNITITNPDAQPPLGGDSGFITVTGLLNADWAVTQVVDCTTADESYNNQGGGLWTNPNDAAITLEAVGTGIWTIGVLEAGESICLKLCGTDPNVGNKTLDIKVSQS